MTAGNDFRQAVDRNYEALHSLVNGDSAPIHEVWSQSDDVTAFLGFGGYEKGWQQVRERFDWVSRRFGGGETRTTELSVYSSG
ncbi:MAG: hypothetical protein ACREBU_14780, partial [Nitrososphaera sp.]